MTTVHISKEILGRYMSLETNGRVMCEYLWIDGTGEGIRSKCRTMEFEPKEPKGNGILTLKERPPNLIKAMFFTLDGSSLMACIKRFLI